MKFSHWLGLVPILADPNEFESFDKDAHTDLLNEKNTIVFKMHVKCQKERFEREHCPRFHFTRKSVLERFSMVAKRVGVGR